MRNKIAFVLGVWAAIVGMFWLASENLTRDTALMLLLVLTVPAVAGIIAYMVADYRRPRGMDAPAGHEVI